MTSHSEQLNDLAAALARTQSQLGTVPANGVGHIETEATGRSYRYATLASLWEAIRKPLTDNGLAVLQTCEPGNRGEVRLTTTLLHQSGQWVSGTELIPLPNVTPQGFGSALTYARRYGLAAMVGACADDDDDGASAHGSAPLRATMSVHTNAEPPALAEPLAIAGRQKPRARQMCPAEESWRRIPYNRAKQDELRVFAQMYAKAKGLDSITSDDIRRDFGIAGKLVEHFGATTLGEIIDASRAGQDLTATDSPQAECAG